MNDLQFADTVLDELREKNPRFDPRAYVFVLTALHEVIGERLECDTKTVDNALQRVKRKVGAHLASREVAV